MGDIVRIPTRNQIKEIHGLTINVNNAPYSTLNLPSLRFLSAKSIAFMNYFFITQAYLKELIYNSSESYTFHWGELSVKPRTLYRLTLNLEQVTQFASDVPCPFFNLKYYEISSKNAEFLPKMLIGKSWETPPDKTVDGPLRLLAEFKLKSFRIDKRTVLPSLKRVTLSSISGNLIYLYGLPKNLTHLTLIDCSLFFLYPVLVANFTEL